MQYSESSPYPVFDLNAAASGIYALETGASIEAWIETLRATNIQVFHFDGKQVTTPDRYFEALAALFQFPDYFGGNWDAVADCLTDLAWQAGDRIVVVYSNAQRLREIGVDWNILMEVWASTIEFWQQQGVSLAVVVSGVILKTDS